MGGVTEIRAAAQPLPRERLTLASAPTSSLDAKVAWGHLRRPASIWPVWLLSSSIACLPVMIRSGLTLSATLASTFATASGWRVWSGLMSASTWMASSAPIAMAVRSTSALALGPIVTAMISFAMPFSFRRAAVGEDGSWRRERERQQRSGASGA